MGKRKRNTAIDETDRLLMQTLYKQDHDPARAKGTPRFTVHELAKVIMKSDGATQERLNRLRKYGLVLDSQGAARNNVLSTNGEAFLREESLIKE